MLAADGRVLDASGRTRRSVLTSVRAPPGGGRRDRALRARGPGRRRAAARGLARARRGAAAVVVVQSLADRDETLSALVAAFAVGGPIAVVLASLVGYLLAAAGDATGRDAPPPRRGGLAPHGGRAAPAAGRARRVRRLAETLNEMLDRLAPLVRARGEVRGGREPRAAHAGGDHQDRAGVRAAGRRSRVRGPRVAAGGDRGDDHLAQLAEDLLVVARDDRGRAAGAGRARSTRPRCWRTCATASPTGRASATARSRSRCRPGCACAPTRCACARR